MSDAESVQGEDNESGVTLSDLPQPAYEGAVETEALSTDGDNPNEMREETMNLLTRRIRDRGWLGGPIITDTDGVIADGEHRWRAAKVAGLSEVPVKQFDFSDAERRVVRQELNRIRGEHDAAQDVSEIEAIVAQGGEADIEEVLAFTAAPDELDALFETSESDDVDAFLEGVGDHPAQQPFETGEDGDGDGGQVDPNELYPDGEEGSLARDFIAPPLTTLDARQGYWRTRKKAWHDTGMDSGAGRDAEAFDNIGDANRSGMDTDTSIFDPVLAEVLVSWYAPDAGTVLDPFAGGVVRGAVSAWKGYEYVGVDISEEQIEANEEQYAAISDPPGVPAQERTDPVWVHGDAADLDAAVGDRDPFDFAFTCPPYHDLEQYTDHERDMSNMDYATFLDAYRASIAGTAEHLQDGAFFAIVVGDVRDSDGAYRGLVNETVQAARDAGLSLYNDAVFITPVGSLPIRARNTFNPGRKLGKAHQNVLVFSKGTPDLDAIEERLGDAQVPPVEGLGVREETGGGEWEVED